jgi:SAM-dependent methyltransferase
MPGLGVDLADDEVLWGSRLESIKWVDPADGERTRGPSASVAALLSSQVDSDMVEAETFPVPFETVSCPLCHADQPSPFLTASDYLWNMPGKFQIVRCSGCRHVYLNPRPTMESIGYYYPEHYTPYHLDGEPEQPEAATEAEGPPLSGQPWYLSRFVRGIPGLRAMYYWLLRNDGEFIPVVDAEKPHGLEVGCAGGGFLNRLRKCGWEVQGVELSEAPALLAREQGLRVHVGTLETAEFPDETFDAVFAWMVVEHLHDPQETLREIRRILKPGGWFAFSVPNLGCWEPKVFGKYWYCVQAPTHLHHFTPRTIRRLLGETGFVTERIIHQRNLLNLPGSLGIWLKQRCPGWSLGRRLIEFTNHPGLCGELAMSPLAKLLATLRQGGRLTVVAQRGPAAIK